MEFPYTICFRATPEMHDWLRELADDNHRRLGEVVRMLLEEIQEREIDG